MTTESAVDFATSSRIHMALAVNKLDESMAFYRVLFGQEPTKVRPRYAKFEVAEPPVNLSLNEVCGDTQPSHSAAHFGIQLKSTATVKSVADRLSAAGIQTIEENRISCCYAVQNKVWVTDPDANNWEVYVLLDDEGTHHNSSAGGCCPTFVPLAMAAEHHTAEDRGCKQRADRPVQFDVPIGNGGVPAPVH